MFFWGLMFELIYLWDKMKNERKYYLLRGKSMCLVVKGE